MDETSDISRTEEVSLCLRYVINGETKENFVGFFATASTEGEVLYELAKTAINKLDLRLENIIAECFDGAANMSGIRKNLAYEGMFTSRNICTLLWSSFKFG